MNARRTVVVAVMLALLVITNSVEARRPRGQEPGPSNEVGHPGRLTDRSGPQPDGNGPTFGEGLAISMAGCAQYALSDAGEQIVDVPSFCIDGLCRIMLWHDATIGAFGPGISWPVYYTQRSADASWIGGPSLAIGGFSYSAGAGINGDDSGEGIFLGGTTADGGTVSLYDDSDAESSLHQWTVEVTPDGSWEDAAFFICPLVYERYDVSAAGTTSVDVPSFCYDDMCGVLLWNDATMGAFGPGIYWPAYYSQDSSTGDWIGGPNISLGGASFSAGAGTNGDATSRAVMGGGQTTSGGYAYLYDDHSGTETSADRWTIDFNPDADLTQASYFIYPLECVGHHVSAGPTVEYIDVPQACVHGVCTILAWNDATMGTFGPGLHWPVYYTQSPADDGWIGGPSVALGGVSFSDGAGTNGDTSGDALFTGGRTTPGDHYASLWDDYGALENSADQWSIVFNPGDDLSAASFYICLGACQRYNVMMTRLLLPIVLRN